MNEPTFICADCKIPVFDVLGQVRERCLTCQWVAEIEDPVEREKVHEFLAEINDVNA
jgi:hypothetical protein